MTEKKLVRFAQLKDRYDVYARQVENIRLFHVLLKDFEDMIDFYYCNGKCFYLPENIIELYLHRALELESSLQTMVKIEQILNKHKIKRQKSFFSRLAQVKNSEDLLSFVTDWNDRMQNSRIQRFSEIQTRLILQISTILGNSTLDQLNNILNCKG